MGKMYTAIGLMSGTSMDGIDIAMIETDGDKRLSRRSFESVTYDPIFRRSMQRALVDAVEITARDQRPGCLAHVERVLTEKHAEVISKFLADHGLSAVDVDVIGFHGQTVLHRPDDRLTVQIGDGRLLASASGIDVVYDMRAADVAAGGQGAPLAPIYHHALAEAFGAGSTAVLNIGGVANVTFIATDGSLLAFDTGPGNALLDDWIATRTSAVFDCEGRFSSAGTPNAAVLSTLMSDPYFSLAPPKSLDRNHFCSAVLDHLSIEDGAATLAAFTVQAIEKSVVYAPEPPKRWIVTGGGRHNPTLMANLKDRLPGHVEAAETAGFNGDAVEAEAWAYLAVRNLLGKAITFPSTTGVPTEMTGGLIAKSMTGSR